MIALHTFLVVFLRWSMRRRSLFVMLGTGWLLVLLIVIIGPAGYIANKGPFCTLPMSLGPSNMLITEYRWYQRLLLLDFHYIWRRESDIGLALGMLNIVFLHCELTGLYSFSWAPVWAFCFTAWSS